MSVRTEQEQCRSIDVTLSPWNRYFHVGDGVERDEP
jgi:hypothetical protein